MISKGETFKPPTPEEEWTDRQFSIVLNYLSEWKVPYNGQILLQWLAMPYISIWKSGSTSDEGSTVWIMHNNLQTDHFIGSSDVPLREVIKEFGDRWIAAGEDLAANPDQPVANPDEVGDPVAYGTKMKKYGEMFISVSEDDELWAETAE